MSLTQWTQAAAAVLVIAGGSALAQQRGSEQQSCCRGERHGGGRGMMMDADHQSDMAMFHFLLDHKDAIERTVNELPNGVETVTESNEPEIADAIREHVASMYRRLDDGRPIHRRDPLFAEIFAHADAIEMTMEDTERGLRVRETSSDPYVAELIKSHARVVSAFIANGRPEMRKNHPVPEREN
jgi:hypothetical protein